MKQGCLYLSVRLLFTHILTIMQLKSHCKTKRDQECQKKSYYSLETGIIILSHASDFLWIIYRCPATQQHTVSYFSLFPVFHVSSVQLDCISVLQPNYSLISSVLRLVCMWVYVRFRCQCGVLNQLPILESIKKSPDIYWHIY